MKPSQLLPRVSFPVSFHLAQGTQTQEKETCWLATSNYPKLLPPGWGAHQGCSVDEEAAAAQPALSSHPVLSGAEQASVQQHSQAHLKAETSDCHCQAGRELPRMPAGLCWADSLPHLNSPLIPSLSLQLYSWHHCLSVECLVELSRWVSCAVCPDITGLTMTGIEDVGGQSGEAK